ncbi:MAG: hypothetical protein VX588_07105, partial [Verrucomicrobiota bacterium]|nr:hypothetical protein [Verrucomicrobiota bacterium]
GMDRELPLHGGGIPGAVLYCSGCGLGSRNLQFLPSAHAASGKRSSFKDGRTLWVGHLALFQEKSICDFHGGFSPSFDGNDAVLGNGQYFRQLLRNRTFRGFLYDGADGRACRTRFHSAGLYQAIWHQVDHGDWALVLGTALCALLRGSHFERVNYDDFPGHCGAAPRVQLRLCFCFGLPVRGQARWRGGSCAGPGFAGGFHSGHRILPELSAICGISRFPLWGSGWRCGVMEELLAGAGNVYGVSACTFLVRVPGGEGNR